MGAAYFEKFSWGEFETHEDLAQRMGRFAASVEAPGRTTVLVSHGGPCGSCYGHLLKTSYVSAPYTAIFAFVRGDDGEWRAPVVSSTDHLDPSEDDIGLATAGELKD